MDIIYPNLASMRILAKIFDFEFIKNIHIMLDSNQFLLTLQGQKHSSVKLVKFPAYPACSLYPSDTTAF